MRRLLVSLTIASLFTGCNFTSGERTVFWDDQNQISITRTMAAETQDGEWTTAACIALPNDWTAAVTVSVEGIARDNGANTAFSATPASYPAGAVTANTEVPLTDYNWQCWTDIARTYVEGNTGSITWQLTPDTENAMVLTTLGVISADDDDEQFFENITGHQLLADDQTADHWEKVEGETASVSVGYLTFKTLNDRHFLFNPRASGESELFEVTESGINALPNIPLTSNLDFANGYYFSRYTYTAEIDSNNQQWTDVRYSTDLETWSAAVTLPNLAEIQYDAHNSQYVAFTNDYNAPVVNEVYATSDLITWTNQGWSPSQTPTVTFMENGLGLLDTGSSSSPYQLRDANSGVWSSIDIIPTIVTTDAIRFNVHLVDTFDGDFHTLGLRRFYDGSNTTNENIFYGRSSDGENWNWVSLGAYDDIGFAMSLIYLGEDEYIFPSTDQFLRTTDGGLTWHAITNPIKEMLASDSVEVATDARISSVYKEDDTYYVRATTYRGPQIVAEVFATSMDLETFNVQAITNAINVIPNGHNPLLLELDNYEHQLLQRIVVPVEETSTPDPEPTETTKSSKKGGALGFVFFTMVLLGLTTRRQKAA